MSKKRKSKYKVGRISNSELDTVKALAVSGKGVDEISELLNRSTKSIQRYYDLAIEGIEKPESEQVKTTPKINSLDLMTSPRDEKGQRVIVMSKAASERGEHYAQMASKTVSRTSRGNLFDCSGKEITKRNG